MKLTGKLTAHGIAQLTERGRYSDGAGLCLQVFSSKNRSWILRYERGGRERWLGLGPLHTVPLGLGPQEGPGGSAAVA